MRKAVNPLYFIAMTLLFCFFSTAPLWADETQNNFSIDAKAAIAVDADTGKIFYAQDSTTPMPIASITTWSSKSNSSFLILSYTTYMLSTLVIEAIGIGVVLSCA